jgi:hypothetical protein
MINFPKHSPVSDHSQPLSGSQFDSTFDYIILDLSSQMASPEREGQYSAQNTPATYDSVLVTVATLSGENFNLFSVAERLAANAIQASERTQPVENFLPLSASEENIKRIDDEIAKHSMASSQNNASALGLFELAYKIKDDKNHMVRANLFKEAAESHDNAALRLIMLKANLQLKSDFQEPDLQLYSVLDKQHRVLDPGFFS